MNPVIWRPARGVTHPALAVPCSSCGATIGRHYTALYSQGEPRDPHPMRSDVAEAHGFEWAPGSYPTGDQRHPDSADALPPLLAVLQGQGALFP